MRYTIEGGSLPLALIQLEPGETILSEAGGRTWMKGDVITDTRAEGGLGKSIGRMFSGESLFMTRYTARGPAEIGFASSFPGKILPVELQPGQSIICQKSAFLCGVGNISLSIHFKKKVGAGFFGGEGLIDTVVTGPGKVWLQSMTVPKLAGLIAPYIATKSG